MSLFLVTGYLLSENLGWDWALPAFLVAGLLVAPLIPAKGACKIKSGPASENPDPGEAKLN